MKKNRCAQEMILDLVMRHECTVKIRPPMMRHVPEVELIISRDEYYASATIDLERVSLIEGQQEEMVCRIIERAAADLFRYPYKRMIEKHFHKEAEKDE